MSELTTHQPGGVAEKIEWSRAIAPASLLPKAYQKNPANLLLAAEYADALGIERINALTSIHVIEGRPAMSADLMVALARRAGHKVRVQTAEGAVKATLIRADDPEFEYSVIWDMKRAQQAGLTGKSVWKAYPQAMLRSRALSEVIRQGASEVLIGGIYTPEELNVPVAENGQPLRPQPVTEGISVAELLAETEVVDEEVPPANPETGEVVDGELFGDYES